jgi:hypothetical protein
MSASRFPRVASRTRPRPERPPSLPPLLVGIYHAGELIRTTTLPDPRAVFCAEYSQRGGNRGLTARPLDRDEVSAAPARRLKKGGGANV